MSIRNLARLHLSPVSDYTTQGKSAFKKADTRLDSGKPQTNPPFVDDVPDRFPQEEQPTYGRGRCEDVPVDVSMESYRLYQQFSRNRLPQDNGLALKATPASHPYRARTF